MYHNDDIPIFYQIDAHYYFCLKIIIYQRIFQLLQQMLQPLLNLVKLHQLMHVNQHQLEILQHPQLIFQLFLRSFFQHLLQIYHILYLLSFLQNLRILKFLWLHHFQLRHKFLLFYFSFYLICYPFEVQDCKKHIRKMLQKQYPNPCIFFFHVHVRSSILLKFQDDHPSVKIHCREFLSIIYQVYV